MDKPDPIEITKVPETQEKVSPAPDKVVTETQSSMQDQNDRLKAVSDAQKRPGRTEKTKLTEWLGRTALMDGEDTIVPGAAPGKGAIDISAVKTAPDQQTMERVLPGTPPSLDSSQAQTAQTMELITQGGSADASQKQPSQQTMDLPQRLDSPVPLTAAVSMDQINPIEWQSSAKSAEMVRHESLHVDPSKVSLDAIPHTDWVAPSDSSQEAFHAPKEKSLGLPAGDKAPALAKEVPYLPEFFEAKPHQHNASVVDRFGRTVDLHYDGKIAAPSTIEIGDFEGHKYHFNLEVSSTGKASYESHTKDSSGKPTDMELSQDGSIHIDKHDGKETINFAFKDGVQRTVSDKATGHPLVEYVATKDGTTQNRKFDNTGTFAKDESQSDGHGNSYEKHKDDHRQNTSMKFHNQNGYSGEVKFKDGQPDKITVTEPGAGGKQGRVDLHKDGGDFRGTYTDANGKQFEARLVNHVVLCTDKADPRHVVKAIEANFQAKPYGEMGPATAHLDEGYYEVTRGGHKIKHYMDESSDYELKEGKTAKLGTTDATHYNSGDDYVKHADGSSVWLKPNGEVEWTNPEDPGKKHTDHLTQKESDFLKAYGDKIDTRDFAEMYKRLHGDAKQIEPVLDAIRKLDEIEKDKLSDNQKNALRRDIMHDLAYPQDIYQGGALTCPEAVVQRDFALQNPVRYVEILKDAFNGTVKLTDTPDIKLTRDERLNLSQPDLTGRNMSAIAFQTVAFKATEPNAQAMNDVSGMMRTKDGTIENPGQSLQGISQMIHNLGGGDTCIVEVKSPQELIEAYKLGGDRPMILGVNSHSAPFGGDSGATKPEGHVVTGMKLEGTAANLKIQIANQYGWKDDHSEVGIDAKTVIANGASMEKYIAGKQRLAANNAAHPHAQMAESGIASMYKPGESFGAAVLIHRPGTKPGQQYIFGDNHQLKPIASVSAPRIPAKLPSGRKGK